MNNQVKHYPCGSAFLFAILHKIATFFRTSEKAYEKLIFVSTKKCGFFEKSVLKKLWEI